MDLKNILLFPASDEDIMDMALMSDEEVNNQLVEFGLNPDSPLPERLITLISAKEDQRIRSDGKGSRHYISGELETARLHNNRLADRLAALSFRSFWLYATPILIGVLGLICVIGVSNSGIRNRQADPAQFRGLFAGLFASRSSDGLGSQSASPDPGNTPDVGANGKKRDLRKKGSGPGQRRSNAPSPVTRRSQFNGLSPKAALEVQESEVGKPTFRAARATVDQIATQQKSSGSGKIDQCPLLRRS